MIKGNKGEWSEIYVLISLLADGKLYQSDINLNKDEENIYHVLKGYKTEKEYILTFNRKDQNITIHKGFNNTHEEIKTISINEFKELSKNIYKGIVESSGSSFRIVEIEDLISSFHIKTLKEKSSEKVDIRLKIYDHRLAKETDLGFSIKSLIGGKSTLFNAGKDTNFIYKILTDKNIDTDNFNKRTYKLEKGSKITNRLKELEKLNSIVKYESIQSNQLWKNLKMVDGDLPKILAYALYYRWYEGTSSLKEISDILEDKDPLNFYCDQESEQKLYKYKLMRFLTECAMGMTSQTPWLGEYKKFGGVIVAKEDGDIVAFHIYDFNLFREYLINNTIFEQAGTGEDKENPGHPNVNSKKNYNYGWLYNDNGNLRFKINLQIRFSK